MFCRWPILLSIYYYTIAQLPKARNLWAGRAPTTWNKSVSKFMYIIRDLFCIPVWTLTTIILLARLPIFLLYKNYVPVVKRPRGRPRKDPTMMGILPNNSRSSDDTGESSLGGSKSDSFNQSGSGASETDLTTNAASSSSGSSGSGAHDEWDTSRDAKLCNMTTLW